MEKGKDFRNAILGKTLEDTASYAGLLLAPSEGFGAPPAEALFALRAKRAYHAVSAHFRPFLVYSSNLGKF